MILKVKVGSVMLPKRKGEIARRFLLQGDTVQDGDLEPEDIERLVEDGIISIELPVAVGEKQALPPTKGKWHHDPSKLADRSLKDLRVMVHEIDPKYKLPQGFDPIDEIGMLVRILSADYDPLFTEEPPKSTDSSRPFKDTFKSPSLNKAKAAANQEE